MRHVDWKVECNKIALYLLIAGFIGWIFGILPWALLLVSLVYIAWTLYQLQRVKTWLLQPPNVELPESGGLWGDVFDSIHQLQVKGRKEVSRLQATVDYLQDSFSSLEDATVMLGDLGEISWSNEAAEKTLGLRFPEDRNQQLINLVRSPEFIRYFEKGDYSSALQITSPYNTNYQLLITITYFGKGSRLLFARDITETNRLLEMRKDFVANVSHELRTPLTVITGYLETMSDMGGNNDQLPDELRWRRVIDQMLNQSRRMESLIKDLIVLSRLESVNHQSTQVEIDVAPMLAMIREEVLAAIKGKREIIIECDEDLRLLGNNDEIRSAFSNLVMNAAKYSGEDGTVWVRWEMQHKQPCFTVEDDGEGIDSHHIPRLTERFYRVDKSRSIETGGTGLGLAIVKHILLRHEAELQITSHLGEGSCFSCVFPSNRALSRSEIA
jgi:two-component system phosphate regulon sensor histidine kinase PhoR